MSDKFLVKVDQDDGEIEFCEPDDPAYDGPESNINEDPGVYHIEAESYEEAEKAAQWLDSMGNDYSSHDIDSETEFYGDEDDDEEEDDEEDEDNEDNEE